MVVLITYDLHKPERDYDKVIKRLESFGTWAHLEESVWLVDTLMDPEDCRDALKSVSEDATYFVVEIERHWSSYKVASAITQWLKNPQRRW